MFYQHILNCGNKYHGGHCPDLWSRMSADTASRPNTAPSSVERSPYHSHPHHPYHGRDRSDMQLLDVHSSDETSSVLDADTRFVPVLSEMSMSPLRPFNLGSLLAEGGGQDRPRTAPDKSYYSPTPSSCAAAEPMEDRTRSSHRRLAANFSQQSKAQSGIPQPKVNVPAGQRPAQSSTPPSAYRSPAMASPGSHGNTEPPASSTTGEVPDLDGLSTDSSQASLELKLLKALLDKRNATRKPKRSSRKSQDSTPTKSTNQPPLQYTPDKYKSPARRQRGNPPLGDAEVEGGRLSHIHSSNADASVERLIRHSANSRPDKITLDDPEQELKEKTLAATKLQAIWRGVLVRQKDPFGLRARKELRTRRSEDHIRFLQSEVERQKQMYEHEKQLRSIQVEAMKYLWKEVQELQKWRTTAARSHDLYQRPLPVRTSVSESSEIRMENIPNIIESLEKGPQESGPNVPPVLPPRDINFPIPSLSSPNPTTVLPPGVHYSDIRSSQISQTSASASTTAQSRVSEKEAELENVCKSLQKQVSHLQEVLTSMSQVVFQGGGGGPSPEKPETGLETIRLSANFEEGAQSSSTARRTVATIPAPEYQACQPGIPTAPLNLVAQLYNTAVVLHWQASVVMSTQGTDIHKQLLGYRVYVNGIAKGMTLGCHTKVLVDNLLPNIVYRITIRAVSVLGESQDSNMVIISPDPSADSSSPGGPGGPGGPRDGGEGPGDDGPGPRDPGRRGKDSSDKSRTSPGLQRRSPQLSPKNGHSSDGHGEDHHHQSRTSSSRDSLLPSAPKYLLHRDNSPADDSGYLTSPGNTSVREKNRPQAVVRERSNDDLKSIPEGEAEGRTTPRKSTLSDHSLSKDTYIIGSAYTESPKIQEGLLKIEGSREIKQAVKTQKQKPSGGDKTAPLKAMPSDPDLVERGMCESDDDQKKLSKIPKYMGKADDNGKHNRKNSSDSSEGSRSRRSSLTDSRSRRSSGNDEPKSRKGSSSDADQPSSTTKSTKAKLPTNLSKEDHKRYLAEASASVRASLEKNQMNSVKVKSNTIGSDSPLNGSPVTAKEATPQRHTWAGEKNKNGGSAKKLSSDDEDNSASGSAANSHVPRPPDEVGSPRKNSFGRRNSFRGRHRSGSESSRDGEHEGDNVSGKTSENTGSESDLLDPSSSPDHRSKQNFSRHSRSRASVREARKPKEVKTEKRAASVGAVLNRAPGNASPGSLVSNKPPMAHPPHARLQESPAVACRRRTKSEEGTTSSGEQAPAQRASNEPTKESPREKKKTTKLAHRRSASDATGVPSIQIPEPDRRSAPPSTPKQCPSSPRVRRSSSFSKSASGENQGEGAKLVRQCISLETLKAAKSPDNKSKLHSGAAGTSSDQSSSGDDESEVDASYFRRSQSMREGKAKSKFYMPVPDHKTGASSSGQKPQSYSPRLSGKAESDKPHRKIKIPNKAADLFAKLQLKLSNNKN